MRIRHNSRAEAKDRIRAVLRLNGAKCDGHGICVLGSPSRITLDEWGYAVIDSRPLVEVIDIARASRAVRACPAGALELVSDGHVAELGSDKGRAPSPRE
jgi:ferredoxin